jgi:hypothetical protein
VEGSVVGHLRRWLQQLATRVKVTARRYPDIIGTAGVLALAAATIVLIIVGILIAHAFAR